MWEPLESPRARTLGRTHPNSLAALVEELWRAGKTAGTNSRQNPSKFVGSPSGGAVGAPESPRRRTLGRARPNSLAILVEELRRRQRQPQRRRQPQRATQVLGTRQRGRHSLPHSWH